MAEPDLPEEMVAALAEARKLRERYEQQGKFPLIWVTRERYLQDGIRRSRIVVKTFARRPPSGRRPTTYSVPMENENA